MELRKDTLYHLAGATGTEILRRGFPTKLPLWSAQVLFDKPELLKQIYLDYITAGADIITTNTFRTQRRTLTKAGVAHETERINRLAVEIAVEARKEAQADRPIYIAGCMTTLEDCYRPDLMPSEPELRAEHTEQATLLASTPIDFFLLETFNTIQEAVIASEAVSKTKKPFMVSFTANEAGDILNGDTWDEAVRALTPLRPLAILVNCVPPAVAEKAIQKIKKATALPFGVYGNGAGGADNEDGWKFDEADKVQDYLHSCKEWVAEGATIIGGCCGTNHDYTRAYSALTRH
ncbi:MAG: homocysteine S-methyltransferase family protein [bacterium]|nr:homocysteine S-methyltransferase family protein [bacterium]